MTTTGRPMTPKYRTLYCVVRSEQVYGLVVDTETDEPGYIDSEFIADAPSRRERWPAVNTSLRVMVIGHSGDGRLILSARHSDLTLADTVTNVRAAMRVWQTVEESGAESTAARDAFFRSPDAAALLRWAYSHTRGTSSRELAQALLPHAPETIKREFDPE